MASPTSEIAVGSAVIASLGLAIAAYKIFGRPQPPEAESESIDPQPVANFAEIRSLGLGLEILTCK